jgi:hypothetical protein
MNSLPENLLLKIFNKIPWYYDPNSLKLVCKKWNTLISENGIYFETDYNLRLVIFQNSTKIFDHEKLIKTYKYNIYDDKKLRRLLRIPVYKLKISGSNEKYNSMYSDMIPFYNKHIKKLYLMNDHGKYAYELTNLRSLIIHSKGVNLSKLLIQNQSTLKQIKFIKTKITKSLFVDLYMTKNLIEIIRFKKCYFNLDKEDYISDLFTKNPFNNNIRIYFEECSFNKKEFDVNETEFKHKYLISKLLCYLDNGQFVKTTEFDDNNNQSDGDDDDNS